MKMNLLAKLREYWIVINYEEVGLRWGDMYSYSYLGKAVGLDKTEARLKKLEEAYKSLGYVPLPRTVWIQAGGYGKEYKHLLRQKDGVV